MRNFDLSKIKTSSGAKIVCSVIAFAAICFALGLNASAQSTNSYHEAFEFHNLETKPLNETNEPDREQAQSSLEALEYAARDGDEIAMWQLGRHYAVKKHGKVDHLRAFEMFSQVVRAQRDQTPYSGKAPFTAHALVSLGTYYRRGIPNTRVEKNTDLAWSMFMTAATYYGNPTAQYALFEMCDQELSHRCSSVQAGRWLKLSAVNGNIQAQAQFGSWQFDGENDLRRDKISGLTWLTIAKNRAHNTRHSSIFDRHQEVFSLSNADERHEAGLRAEKWMQEHCSDAVVC